MRGYYKKNARRRGVAIVYIVCILTVMLGFCSLAVDLGRVQTAKTELRRAVDAAARAGAAFIPQGLSAVQTEAIAVAGVNKVDTKYLSLSNSNIVIGSWVGGVWTKNGTPANAVLITYTQSIPLVFGTIIGMPSCNVDASSTAALVSQSSTTQFVSAHGNPWLAGEPAGTTGSVPDTGYGYTAKTSNNTHPWEYDIANPTAVQTAVNAAGSSGAYTPPSDPNQVETTDYTNNEPYGSPSEFTLTPGSIVEVTTSSNFMSTNSGYLDDTGKGISYNADGSNSGTYSVYSDDAANPSLAQGSVTTSGTEHGISNTAVPLNSVIGVFMDQNGAEYGADSTQEANESNSPATPTGQDFSTQTERDYTTIDPTLNQMFYIGNGQTSVSNTQQLIVVPNNASALFLGTMDGHEWSNNQGGGDVTVTVYQIEIVK